MNMELLDDDFEYCVLQPGHTCSGYDRCGECAWQNMELELTEI